MDAWQYVLKEISLWSKVIDGKYGVQSGGWCLEKARGPYGVSPWRNIRNSWGNFFNFVSFRVGMVPAFAFGMMWCGEASLKITFLNLFR
jgi:hypothetical protein